LDNGNGSVASDVESRLNDLFGENGEPPETVGDSGDIEDSPVRELKAMVLSLDWEINDEIMDGFMGQIDLLMDQYKTDKIFLLFLQLLGSIGKYIRVNRGGSHPDSIKLLNSVYNSLERVVAAEDMIEAERKKILLAAINRFKKLKHKIAVQKADMIAEKREEPSEEEGAVIKEQEDATIRVDMGKPLMETGKESGPSDFSQMSPHEAFAHALEEIKALIRTEFQILRAEMKSWREGP